MANSYRSITEKGEGKKPKGKRFGKFIAVTVIIIIIYNMIAGSVNTNIKMAKISAKMNEPSYTDSRQYSGGNDQVSSSNFLVTINDEPVAAAGKSDFGFSVMDIPGYNGSDIVEVHGGRSYFTPSEKKYVQDFVTYSEDDFGRPGQVFALISPETISYEYNNISSLYPDGYLKLEGMMMVEEVVYQAVVENGYAVLYRTTPMYADKGSTDSYGMLVEAYSIDDDGSTCNFCIFCYNTNGYQ